MKRGKGRKIVSCMFVNLVIFMLVFSIFISGVYASHEEGHVDEGEVTFVDAGTTPDSFAYNFELLYEGVQETFTFDEHAKLILESEHIAERMAEANTMIDAGDYDSAKTAIEEAEESYEESQSHLEQIGEAEIKYEEIVNTEESEFHNLLEAEKAFIVNEDYLDAIRAELGEKVNSGEVSVEVAGELINDITETATETEIIIIEEKEEIIADVAESSGVSNLEVELAVESEEEEEGVNEEYKEEVNEEEIAALEAAIVQIEKEVEEAKDEGENTNAAEIVLENAKLKLQISEDALENGDYGKAYGQFTSAEHLVINCDRFLKNPDENRDELLEVVEYTDEITGKITEENKKFEEEYDKYKDELIAKYPEKKEMIEKEYERVKKVNELSEKIGSHYSEKMQQLIKEGKTEEEAASIVHDEWVKEYELAYGEAYVPPGFIFYENEKEITEETEEDEGVEELPIWPPIEIEEIPIGRIEWDSETGEIKSWVDGVKGGGGFVEGYEYEHDGYKFEFEEDKYKYTTPGGVEYEVKYPENYETTNNYYRGDEKYEYEAEDGSAWTYTATGYEVVKEGEEAAKEVPYTEDTYAFVGGGSVNNEPTGYVYESDDGKATVWEYSPEYNNYIDPTSGKVYVPPVSTHVEAVEYAGEKKYSHTYYGETWTYDSEKNTWTSDTGKKHTPVTTPAPVGYEDKREYTTDDGAKWTYKEGGVWESSTGEKYTPSPNNYNYYNTETGAYVDHTGEMHETTTGSIKDPYTGKTWSYDSTTGTWNSDSGEKYNPSTGSTEYSEGTSEHQYSYGHSYDSSGKSTGAYSYSGGYYTQNPDGTYGYYNPSGTTTAVKSVTDPSTGVTWSQNADGTWSSSTGETYSGSSSYASGHPDSGGHIGSYSGSGTYSGSGSYSGGSYDGGSYSGGSYSGGDSGGGGSTGGDSGGGGHSDGGGHTGMVIFAEPESPITGKIIHGMGKYRLF